MKTLENFNGIKLSVRLEFIRTRILALGINGTGARRACAEVKACFIKCLQKDGRCFHS